MGTLNQIFSGVKSFFKRKDKPKENIKMINEVTIAPVALAARLKNIHGNSRYHRRPNHKFRPVSFGNSVFKMSQRCTKSYIN